MSGSGKSSLVKAGLIPYLRANQPEEWYIIPTLRPGESPFAALAEAIVDNIETTENKIDTIKSLSKTLKQAPRQFLDVIANWRQISTNTRLLLVIDQFDELITISKKQEREQFLNFLGEALTAHSQQLCLVLTLRSDFEPRFLDSALKANWMSARFPVRAMRADELRQAIERPALEKMLDFEPPELVSYLIDEVGQMSGALSLLSFTLEEEKNFSAAISILNLVIQFNPAHADAYYHRGKCYAEWNNNQKTTEDFKEAATLYQQQKKTETEEYQEVMKFLNHFKS